MRFGSATKTHQMKYTENFIYVLRPYRNFTTSYYQSENCFSKCLLTEIWDDELPIDIANAWQISLIL